MKFDILQSVSVKDGYRGYYSGVVVSYDYGPACRYVVEFSSGMQMSFYEDELEAA